MYFLNLIAVWMTSESHHETDKGAEQLRGNHSADRRICFRCIDSFPLETLHPGSASVANSDRRYSAGGHIGRDRPALKSF